MVAKSLNVTNVFQPSHLDNLRVSLHNADLVVAIGSAPLYRSESRCCIWKPGVDGPPRVLDLPLYVYGVIVAPTTRLIYLDSNSNGVIINLTTNRCFQDKKNVLRIWSVVPLVG